MFVGLILKTGDPLCGVLEPLILMKILKFALAAVACAQSAAACDFCAIYSATEARAGKGFYAGAAEQFTRFGTLQDNGKEVPNETGQFLNSSISQLFAGYNFNDCFGVQFTMPVIYRSFQRPEGFTTDRGTSSGLGDVSISGKYLAWRHLSGRTTVLWNILGGVKFPTGNPDRIKEEFNEVEIPGAPVSGIHGHDLTLGTGSYDGLVGTGFYARWEHLFFSASGQYSIRTEGAFDYQFANDLSWNGGPGVLLIMEDNFTLSLQANISGEFKKRDTFQGELAEDTGITSVYQR
jgi:Putative MetA-pathway of phenol degradation